jgi:hypothetical protein
MRHQHYSSLSAFLAHYRALRSASVLNESERAALAELDRAVARVDQDVIRAALDDNADTAAARRRIERARRTLVRELAAQGIIGG